MIETNDRAIRLEGSFNFRDLGGLQTASGDMVRMGRLFRADSLSTLTDSDLEILAGKQLATVIDLRSQHELAEHGSTRLVDSGARHLHMPIHEGTQDPTAQRIIPETLGELYVQMVDNASDRFVAIFQTIAQPENLPSVFHCAAGKDRTGVTAALILGLLGVPKHTIVADYAITDANMHTLIETRAKAGKPLATGQYPEGYMRAVPETMDGFLTVLEERWGSIEGFLDHMGVSTNTRNAIREQMLG
jgi:protein-tyrosine phosphatase